MTTGVHAQVVINEVQSSNTIIVDDDGDNEDWIELYNRSDSPVNLNGYWLSDDYDNPTRWAFPDVTLGAGETMVVWASNKDRHQPGLPLHTNFAISAGGEEILLSMPNGQLVDEALPVAIPTDISWGRYPNGADNWVFFEEPTPGADNVNEGYSEILEPPTFSASGGFYNNEFALNISHSDSSVTVVYTTDGSIPALESVGGVPYQYKNQYREMPYHSEGELLTNEYESHIYDGAITVEDRSSQPNKVTAISTSYHGTPGYLPDEPVFKGTVVRARAFKDGARASPIVTHTYFITDSGDNQFSLPVVSFGIQEDALFGYHDGIHVAGSQFDQWRDRNSRGTPDGGTPANWHMRGVEWERPAHLELFEPGEIEAGLQQDLGVRIHGGWSRSGKLKSLRLYARNAYGDSRFNYQIFPDLEDDRFNRLVLRSSGNDRTYTLFRDAMIQALGEGLRLDTQAYRPTVTFINGEYWGILNFRERYDRHYLARTYDINSDNIDYISNYDDVGEGDDEHYQETLRFLENNSLVADAQFEEIKTRIDTDNYMDYTIANIFANNTDWPANNIDFWRLRTDEYQAGAPVGHDGRWRWLWFDADFGFGLYDGSRGATNNTLRWATQSGGFPNRDWSTIILRRLLENPEFKNDFVNRFSDLLNTNFSSDYVVSVIEDMKAAIEPEMADHIERWSHPEDMDKWHDNVDVMVDFAHNRPYYQRQHLRDYFGLGGDYTLTVGRSQAEQGHVRVNSIVVREGTAGVSADDDFWTGSYFAGVPIQLEAIPNPGYEFSHWSGLPEGTPAVVDLEPFANLDVTPHFVVAEAAFVHAWLFDRDLANNTPLEEVIRSFGQVDAGTGRITFHSALAGYPRESDHEQRRHASMERRNAPTPINHLMDEPYSDVGMRGLQIRQPFVGDGGENTLIFEMPTAGQSNVVFRFAAKDEGAAERLVVDYSVIEGQPVWVTGGLSQTLLPLTDEFQLYSLDFSNINDANDNPNFKVRIRFDGADMSVNNGDRVTFNNISLESLPTATDPGDEPDPGGSTRPGNDRFADAEVVRGTEGIVMGSSQSATTEAGEPDHSQVTGVMSGPSVWWTWRATETDRMLFAADSSSAVVVYTGDRLDQLTPVESHSDAVNERLFVAQAGQTYKVAVSKLEGLEGDIALIWQAAAPVATPQVFNTEGGQPGVLCEVPGCQLNIADQVEVISGSTELLITLPQGADANHLHQLRHGSQWNTQFSTALAGVASRIIADTEGLPVVISALTLDGGHHYQVEAYPDGLARQRIVTDSGERLRIHFDVPGSSTHLANDGGLTVAAALPGREGLRVLLEATPDALLTARYQRRTGSTWQDVGEVLTRTEFPAGSIVKVTRDDGTVKIHIESDIESNVSF